ncbi:hypothetical protein I3843_16G098000 [Carya illinoinensis]|nr:hypothetical protein I3843_16G098000 [Carya illinoinensis]
MKIIAISSLILRILTLASIIASIVLLVTDKATFEGLPFVVYYTSKGKRLICNGYLPEFDFFRDKLASGYGCGCCFAVSIDIERISGNAFKNFYTRGDVAAGVLLIGTVCMALVFVL